VTKMRKTLRFLLYALLAGAALFLATQLWVLRPDRERSQSTPRQHNPAMPNNQTNSKLDVPSHVVVSAPELLELKAEWNRVRATTTHAPMTKDEFEATRKAASRGDLKSVVRLVVGLEALSAQGKFDLSESNGKSVLRPISISELTDVFASESEIELEIVALLGILSRAGLSDVSYEYAVRAGDIRKSASPDSDTRVVADSIASDALRALLDAQEKGSAAASWRLAISYARGELSEVNPTLAEQFAKRAEQLDPVTYAGALRRLKS
jgi:hypothetical protein